MKSYFFHSVLVIILSISFAFGSFLQSQAILPPLMEWNGKSETLIAKTTNPWITLSEKSGFVSSPSYEETMNWIKKLCISSPLLTMVDIGTSPEGRTIYMVIASTDKLVTASSLSKSPKPLFLAQAGIHSGEIDGKDAGMMILRDIAHGGRKDLINKVNLLFIPILSVDAHEQSSAYGRPNQRGPEKMGWRTNSQNLNLNRDYTKLDTKELRAVMKVIKDYDPILYMDIHVTDGADYQYDITYGGVGKPGYSPHISLWLEDIYKTNVDSALYAYGHVPGRLLNAYNALDFSKGNVITSSEPRFSDGYGDLRHLPTLLIENHSLKPYKQRVLGTYVLLESTLKLLANKGAELKSMVAKDKALRPLDVPMAWKVPQFIKGGSSSLGIVPPPDSFLMLGVKSVIRKSSITNTDFIEWLGQPITSMVATFKPSQPVDFIARPKGYMVPASSYDVIERLNLHGIKVEVLTKPKEISVEMYRIKEYKVSAPYEGRTPVRASASVEKRSQVYAKGSIFVSTDQPLGDLVTLLLEPSSNDSFFSWGFFSSIFQRTEYIEEYIMEPMMRKMLEDSDDLKWEFENKKASDANFAKDPNAIYRWFYSKTPYYDERYLLYPVGRVVE